MKIVIEGEPIPQLRPKITGNRMYDPAKISNYKKLVAWESKRQYKGKPMTGPLIVELIFYRQIPKTDSIKTKQDKLSGVIRPTVKPDLDNYVKGVLDAMNKIVFKDDNQIIRLVAEKHYSDNPRVIIQVKPSDS